jgi:Imelysin
MMRRSRRALLIAAATIGLAGCAGGDSEESGRATKSTPRQHAASANLGAVKTYLLRHTAELTSFTQRFRQRSSRYRELAQRSDFDPTRLWQADRRELTTLLSELKSLWIEGNPSYERMEGVVAGTPSLAEYDVILDAGSSAAEDPQSAVPFDLELGDRRVLEQPGNLFNLTEGALWGTLPAHLAGEVASTPVDLDGDGRKEFGEVLPDARLLAAAAEAFDRYAADLAASARAWEPRPSDAFTALVVMVPTMSEYFGQWKESRFVRGEAATGDSFNVVSRLSDINDILTGLETVYASVRPVVASTGPERAAQTAEELSQLRGFVAELRAREAGGKRFTPEQADTFGSEAQERASAVAGQVSQAAAELEIPIEQ